MPRPSVLLVPLESMQEPMEHRRDEQCRGDDESQPGIKRLQTRKQLSRFGLWWIDRPHPAQQHGRVEGGVDPRQILEAQLAEHADGERCSDQAERECRVAEQAFHELGWCQRRLLPGLVHGMLHKAASDRRRSRARSSSAHRAGKP